MLIVNPIAIQVHVTGTLAWALLGSFLMNSGHVWTRLDTFVHSTGLGRHIARVCL